jgi:4-amino-4-deoxy-L-arabinose transferase-like glycosyltransferase
MRKKNIYERIEHGNHHVLFAAVPLILFFCLYYVTRFGIGVTPDSTFYISAARSIAQTGEIRSIWGGTKMDYLTHYPPCYPVVIFLFNLIVENTYEAVRFLNCAMIALTSWMIAYQVKVYARNYTAVVAQIVIFLSIPLFEVYQMAWSEGVFIFFSVYGMFTLIRAIERKNNKLFFFSAILTAIAVGTRYAGITLIISNVVILIWLFRDDTLLKRILKAILHGGISISIFAFWFIRNQLLSHNPTDRSFAFHPMGLEYLESFLNCTANYFIPINFGSKESMIIGALLSLLLLYVFYYFLKKGNLFIVRFFTCQGLIYLIFISVSNTFFDYTPFYPRTLQPLYLPITFTAIFYFFHLRTEISKYFKIVFVLYLMLMVVQFFKSVIRVNDGREYASQAYKIPATIKALNSIPNHSKVFSNEVDRIYYLTDIVTDWQQEFSYKKGSYLIMFKNGRSYIGNEFSDASHHWQGVYDSKDVIIKKVID